MEDFREIVGFLIIGIGILLSVLKERKGNKSSDSSAPAQNPPIQRRPINQHPQQQYPQQQYPQQQYPQQRQPQRPITTPRQQAAPAQAATLPFVVSSVAERARQQQGQPSSPRTTATSPSPASSMASASETNAYADLPEEGARVTTDVPPMEPISDYNAQEEEQFIEKLREGIILSEILQRKF